MTDFLIRSQRRLIVLAHKVTSQLVFLGPVWSSLFFPKNEIPRKPIHSDGGAGNGALLKGGCPGEGWSFGYVKEGETSHFAIGIVDFVIDKKIEVDGI